jgi:thioredoxin reductase (NADPH)
MHDIIVVGSGPAGLTASIYARRANKSVLILEKGIFGGQVTFSPCIENYPGYIKMSGNEFADKLIDQAVTLGADIEMETVKEIVDNGDTKVVKTNLSEHTAKAVIIATGCKHRQIGLPNENALIGNGISFCATCDGAFFKNKTVAVLGGGNSALQEAILLSDLCSKVYVIQNLDFLTGEDKLCKILENKSNVEIIYGTIITELIGEDELKSIVLKNEKDGSVANLDVDGLFIAIGLVPDNESFSNIANLNNQGYFDSDETCSTKTKGIFTAGDCRNKSVRQITTAVADGAVAALAAVKYIDE